MTFGKISLRDPPNFPGFYEWIKEKTGESIPGEHAFRFRLRQRVVWAGVDPSDESADIEDKDSWHPRKNGPPFRMPTALQGCPIPRTEGYEDGSDKYICSDESEWVKRPDEVDGKMAKIDFYPCESLRGLIHKFQLVGAIRTDVASQILAQMERDGLWVNPCSPMKNRGPDLEYSAIGDKSEPNQPESHDKMAQDFEYRLGRLESRLNNEVTARQLSVHNIHAMILADSRLR